MSNYFSKQRRRKSRKFWKAENEIVIEIENRKKIDSRVTNSSRLLPYVVEKIVHENVNAADLMLIGPLNGGNGLMRNSSMMKYSVTVVDLQKFQKNQE